MVDFIEYFLNYCCVKYQNDNKTHCITPPITSHFLWRSSGILSQFFAYQTKSTFPNPIEDKLFSPKQFVTSSLRLDLKWLHRMDIIEHKASHLSRCKMTLGFERQDRIEALTSSQDLIHLERRFSWKIIHNLYINLGPLWTLVKINGDNRPKSPKSVVRWSIKSYTFRLCQFSLNLLTIYRFSPKPFIVSSWS